MNMPVSGLYDSGIIIPVPELSSKFVVSSRQRSPNSSAASGEVTQENGPPCMAFRYVASGPSVFMLMVWLSITSIATVFWNEEAVAKVPSSAPVASTASIRRCILKRMSSAVTSRPPSVGA